MAAAFSAIPHRRKMPGTTASEIFSLLVSDRDLIIDENKLLGKGGFGQVYIGTYPKVYKSQEIAIKIINIANPDVRMSTVREITMLTILGGFPGITKLLAWSENSNGSAFKLAFHIHQCQDVFSMIKIIPQELAVKIIIEILTALQYIHSKGIIHSDIKAENIMLDCNEQRQYTNAVIVDLGSACFEDDKTCLDTTATTVYYMSPERLVGELIDRSSDIWALGVLAWEMLTHGYGPFYADNDDDTARNIVKGKYTIPSYFTADQKAFFDSIFQENPKRRYTAEQLLKSRWLSG